MSALPSSRTYATPERPARERGHAQNWRSGYLDGRARHRDQR